jgi:flagellar motor protein MotB
MFNCNAFTSITERDILKKTDILRRVMGTGKWREIRSKPSVKKVAVATLIFFVVFSITGFLVLPPVLKSLVTKKLSEQLHREVTIRQIKVNPFMLSVTVRGFTVKERNKPDTFVSFDELYVNLQSISLLKRGLIIHELKLVKPYVNIRRNPDLLYNFSDILKSGQARPASGKKTTAPTAMRFSVNNIQILNGSIDFLDGPKQVRHTVRDLNVTVPFVSDIPYYTDTYVQPSFEAVVNNEKVSFKGKTKPFAHSLETSVDIRVKDLDLTHYLAYVPFKMNFRVPSGYLDVDTHVTYVQSKDRAPSLGLTGDIFLTKLKVDDASGAPVVDFPMLGVYIASSELLSKTVHLSKVILMSPDLNVVRDRSGKVNIMALLPEKKKGEAPAAEESKTQSLPRVDADEMTIRDGKLIFTDQAPGGEFRTRVEPLELKISHFSTAPGKKSAVELSLKTEANESLKVDGEFSVTPLTADGKFELQGVPMKKYAPYYRKMVLFDIEDGELGLGSNYSYAATGETAGTRLSGMSISLSGLRLKKPDEKEDFLKVPAVAVKEGEVDLTKKALVLGDVETGKGVVVVKRSKDGILNLATLLPENSKDKDNKDKDNVGKEHRKTASTAPPWLVTLKKISADDFTVKMEDSVPPSPVSYSVSAIGLKAENISTAKGIMGSVSLGCRLGRRGSLKASGKVGIDPVAVQAKIALKGVEIVPFQPYFTDRVKILVTDGAVSTGGDLSLKYAGGGMTASYKGTASLLHFASLDKEKGDEFLKWDSLHFGGLAVSYRPLNLHIKEVALTDFYSRLIIEQNGAVNLQGIVQQAEAGAAAPQPQEGAGQAASAVSAKQPVRASEPKVIRIDTLTLQGGTINFSDRYIKPNYSANLVEIGGRISGLSSEESTTADVDLRGKLDNYAPLEITGKINPLKEDLFVDLKADFRDMELSPLTPYSGRHIGYTIRKGKLFLSMKYLIVKKKLEAQNHIFLDQFTLGDKVESPEATKLPVKLAIALLKNRKGEIDLDIPVSGYINDPKFSLGRIIVKIIVNLLIKAATSPFSLLGKIFGGGAADLSYVEFHQGSAAINDAMAKKLDAIVKALYDRPSLKLEIEGYVDPETDREALRQYIFDRKVKTQKWKDVAAKEGEMISVDEVKVGTDEYPKYLKKAYKAEKFPKPRNILGFAKSLPVPEMEKLMLTNIKVTDDDLRALASRRALAVKDYILKSGEVEPQRVFLVEPSSLSPEKKEKLSNSRVDFKLK